MLCRIEIDYLVGKFWVFQLVVHQYTEAIHMTQVQWAEIEVEIPVNHVVVDAKEMSLSDSGHVWICC